jgi:hypothetical protein
MNVKPVKNKADQLITLQRAEFDKAAALQRRIMHVQISITILSCVAVYAPRAGLSYLMVVLTLICSMIWARLSWTYSETRSAAESLRRTTLISVGLGCDLPSQTLRNIQSQITAEDADDSIGISHRYFATISAAGVERLTEMLEESAFSSAYLLRKSAQETWRSFAFFGAVFVIVTLSLLPFVEAQRWLDLGRIVCSVLVLLVSADVFGSAHAYAHSARLVENTLQGLESLRARGYPLGDLLMILGDYNSAVEKAPTIDPRIYWKHKDRLNALWASR